MKQSLIIFFLLLGIFAQADGNTDKKYTMAMICFSQVELMGGPHLSLVTDKDNSIYVKSEPKGGAEPTYSKLALLKASAGLTEYAAENLVVSISDRDPNSSLPIIATVISGAAPLTSLYRCKEPLLEEKPKGSDTFINAVKSLYPLGTSYAEAEKNLIQQGYTPIEPAHVLHNPPVNGIETFQIQQVFKKLSCLECKQIKIEVIGQIRTAPPPPDEKDIFHVDSFFVTSNSTSNQNGWD